MTPLELRLRQRIDSLLDERERLRCQLEGFRRRNRKRSNLINELRRSRDLWRARATRR